MNKQDIEFLKQLQKELLTQDTLGQANPRFWAIKQPKRIYGTDLDYDGREIIYDGESIGDSLEDLYEVLLDNHEDLNISYSNKGLVETVTIIDEDNEWGDDKIIIYDIEELIEYMIDDLDYNHDQIRLIEYKEEHVIVEDTMFLTLRECQNHLKVNSHHYHKDAYPYAMTAWRSPQVERLISILEKTNWDNIKID